jgi:site-specific recombinase XerD
VNTTDLLPSVQQFSIWIATNPLPGRHRRGSENTIGGYINDVATFARWFIQTNGKDLAADSLHSSDIQEYLNWMQTVRKQKASTVLRHFASIRAYCLFLMKTDPRVTFDRSDGVQLPRRVDVQEKRGLRRVESRQVEDLFLLEPSDQVKPTARPRWLRDRAIVLTFVYVGLRLDELNNVQISDVTLGDKSGTIFIPKGKGRKERYARIPKESRQALRDWLAWRNGLPCSHNVLFVQIRYGEKNTYEPLGQRSMQAVVAYVGQRAGIPRLSPHILRHTAVRIWRKRVKDDRVVAAQMGHSIATMMKYDAISDADMDRGADLVDQSIGDND